MFDTVSIIILALAGLGAGLFGGMLGVGGSIIMIPVMVMLFGQGTIKPTFNQHLYQAAAMIVNVLVVAPALLRHRMAGAVLPAALLRLMPLALLFILLGVAVSNLPIFREGDGPLWLGRMLGAFLAWVVFMNVRRAILGRTEVNGELRITWLRALPVSALTGFTAGLLGVGGGIIAVPLQQMFMKIPLRQAIANSTALILCTAGVGALLKNLTLAPIAQPRDALILASLLGPTAIIGGYLGGALTHKLPLQSIRFAFILILLAAAIKMVNFFKS